MRGTVAKKLRKLAALSNTNYRQAKKLWIKINHTAKRKLKGA